jgi:hypothetical protein
MAVIQIEDQGRIFKFEIDGDKPTVTETSRINKIIRQERAKTRKSNQDNLRNNTEIDRKSGIRRFGLRAALAGAEKKEEEENILRKNYGLGDEDFTRDNRGRLAITKSGGDKLGLNLDRTTLVDEEGFSRYDFSADLAGIVPELSGGVGGTLLGAAVGTAVLGPGFGTLVGGSLGGGFGAAGGQALEETVETATGIQEQTAGEVLKDLRTEFILGAAGEFVVGGTLKLLSPFIKGIKGKPLDEETLKVAGEAMTPVEKGGFGITPSIAALGGPSLLARQQKILEKVLGGTRRLKENYNNLIKTIDRYKQAASGGRELTNLSDDEVGKILNDKIVTKKQTLIQKEKDARRSIIDTFEQIGKDVGANATKDEGLNPEVLSVFEQALKNFDDLNTQKFRSIDAVIKDGFVDENGQFIKGVGDAEIVDTSLLKGYAKLLVARNRAAAPAGRGAAEPATNPASFVSEAFNRLGPKASFTQLYLTRKSLMDSSFEFSGQTGSATYREAIDFIDKLLSEKNIIASAKDSAGALSSDQVEMLRKAASEIPEARGFFKEGIDAFEKLQRSAGLKNLYQSIKEGTLSENTRFLKTLVKDDNPDALTDGLNLIKKMVGEDQAEILRRKLSGQYLRDAINKTMFRADDPSSFKGANFSDAIKNLGKTGKVLFGDDFDKVSSLAEQIRQVTIPNKTANIDIDRMLEGAINNNAPDSLVEALTKIKNTQQDLAEFQSNTIKQNISKGISPELAAREITRSGSTAKDVENIMKELSGPEQDIVRSFFMKNLLDNFSPEVLVKGKELKSLADSFNEAADKGKLKAIFGNDMGEDMARFGRVLALNTKVADGGDLIAANIAASPLENLDALLRFSLLAQVFRHAPTYKAVLADYDLKVKGVAPKERPKILGDAIGSAIVQFTTQQGQEIDREAGQQFAASLESAGVDLGAINDQLSAIRSPSPNTGIGQVDVLQPQQSSIRQRAAENPQVANALGITGATQGLL